MAARHIEAYDATAGASRTFFQNLNGRQDGDPDIVAATIRDAVAAGDPPARLVIGADAHGWISDKLRQQQADLDRWAPSTGTGGQCDWAT